LADVGSFAIVAVRKLYEGRGVDMWGQWILRTGTRPRAVTRNDAQAEYEIVSLLEDPEGNLFPSLQGSSLLMPLNIS
jgi:hypothetical protein